MTLENQLRITSLKGKVFHVHAVRLWPAGGFVKLIIRISILYTYLHCDLYISILNDSVINTDGQINKWYLLFC